MLCKYSLKQLNLTGKEKKSGLNREVSVAKINNFVETFSRDARSSRKITRDTGDINAKDGMGRVIL